MPDGSQPLSRAAAESLTVELGERVLADVAPDEIEILDITAAEYFAAPEAVLDPDRRDEALGFGLEVALLTPYVLAALTPVVQYVGSVLLDTAKDEARPRLEALVRRIFRPRPAAAGGTGVPAGGQATGQGTGEPGAGGEGHLALTPEQARHVRDLALARAHDAGLADGQARLIADSLVGALYVDG